MFESIIHGFLARFLAPYVEDLDLDSLKFGLGKLSLNDLKLKSNIFATIGIDAVELSIGTIGCIQIHVPWRALTSGNISVKLQDVDIVARTSGQHAGTTENSDAASLERLRKNVRERVETLTAQISELRRNAALAASAQKAGKDAGVGLGAKLVRQLLCNFTMDVSAISVALKDTAVGSRFSASLTKAFVRVPENKAKEVKEGTLAKEIGIEGFGIYGGLKLPSGTVATNSTLLLPLDLKLVLVHDQASGDASFMVTLGEGQNCGAALSAQQLRLFSSTLAGIGQESARLQDLLTDGKEWVDLRSDESVEVTEQEFTSLMKRKRRSELDLKELPLLRDSDKWRLQLLWDVVPETMLARWYVPVHDVAEEVKKRKEAQEEEERRKRGFLGWLRGGTAHTKAPDAGDMDEFFQSVRIQADAIEGLKRPQTMKVEISLVKGFLFKLDPGEQETETLLVLRLGKTVIFFESVAKNDWRGVPSLEWNFGTTVDALSATHRQQPILNFGQEHDDLTPALNLVVNNILATSGTLLEIDLTLEPLEFLWVGTLFPSIIKFQSAIQPNIDTTRPAMDTADSCDLVSQRAKKPKKNHRWFHRSSPKPKAMLKDSESPSPRVSQEAGAPDESQATMAQRLEDTEAWLNTETGQEFLEQAKKRIPDEVKVHVVLKGPSLEFPIHGESVWVSLGTISAITPQACNTENTGLEVTFSKAELKVNDAAGIEHKVLSPFHLDVNLRKEPGLTKVDVKLEEIEFRAAPEVAQVVMKAITAVQASLKGDDDSVVCQTEEPAKKVESSSNLVSEEHETASQHGAGYIQDLQKRLKNGIDMEALTQHRFHLSLNLPRISVKLLDCAAPVLQLVVGIQNFEVFYSESLLSVPAAKDFLPWQSNADKVLPQAICLYAEAFNIRVGRFEPILEPFEFAFQVNLTADDGNQMIRLIAHRPLYLNATPSVLRLLYWYETHFQAVFTTSASGAANAARYQLLNLTRDTLTTKKHQDTDIVVQMEPTGPVSQNLDRSIIGADSAVLELSDGTRLPVNQESSVQISASPRMVQMLRPNPEYSLVLVSSPVLLFNDTSLPVEFRSLQGGALQRGNCASSKLFRGIAGAKGGEELGHDGFVCKEEMKDGQLGPGEFASVDVGTGTASTAWEGRFHMENQRFMSWEVLPYTDAEKDSIWSVRQQWRPATDSMNNVDLKQSEGQATVGTSITPVECGDLRLLASYEEVISPAPAEVQCLHIRLLPALRVISALPCEAMLEYRLNTESDADVRSIKLAASSEVSLYDIATPGKVMIRLRLINAPWDTPWSSWGRVTVGAAAFIEEKPDVEVCIPASSSAGVSLILSVCNTIEVSVTCPAWMVDRTGWTLSPLHGGLPLFSVEGIHLCPSEQDGYCIKAKDKIGPTFSLPTSHAESTLVKHPDSRAVCLRSMPLPQLSDDVLKTSISRYIELLPPLLIHNDFEHVVEIRVQDSSWHNGNGDKVYKVGPGATISPQCAEDGNIQFRLAGFKEWSTQVKAMQEYGTVPLALGDGSVLTVDARPDAGISSLILCPRSPYTVFNRCNKPIQVGIRGLAPFVLEPSEQKFIAWIDPRGDDEERHITLSVAGSGQVQISADDGPTVALNGSVSVEGHSYSNETRLIVKMTKDCVETQKNTTTIEVVVHKIALSLVSESQGSKDFLFFELDMLRVCAVSRPMEDLMLLDISLSDIQLDWQSPSSPESAVVIANSGASHDKVMRPFLRLVTEQSRCSSPHIIISSMRLHVDELELNVNDGLLIAVQQFIHDTQVIRNGGAMRCNAGDTDTVMRKLRSEAGLPPHCVGSDDYIAPPTQQVIQIKDCNIFKVKLSVWCALQLRRLGLPKWLQTLLYGIALSKELTLEGSSLTLKPKGFASEGTISDLVSTLVVKYTSDVMSSLGSVLGNSSVFNVPRTPLKLLARATGSSAAGSLGEAGDSFSARVASLTGDEDYVKTQKKLREKKKINKFSQGISAAVSDLGDGLGGMADIVRKPIAGARKDGMGGFARGVGEGLVSSVVKPFNAVGNAVWDVGRGVGAGLHGAALKDKQVDAPRRAPRLLAGPRGAVVEYSKLDALVGRELLVAHQLGQKIEAIVPLGLSRPRQSRQREDNEDNHVLMLIILSAGLILEWIDLPSALLDGSEMDVDPDIAALACLGDLRREVEADLAVDDARRFVDTIMPFPLVQVAWQESSEPAVKPKILVVTQPMGQHQVAPMRFLLPVPWELGSSLPTALFEVLQLAILPLNDDWTAPLRKELSWARQVAFEKGRGGGEVIEKVIVWEVERAEFAVGANSVWLPPFLPTEWEQRWRWMNKGLMKRHPLLDLTIDTHEASTPPVVMLPIWTPDGEWKVIRNQNTDEHGWQYGTGWNAPAWRSSPRPVFDQVRKRKWVRQYQLHMLPSTSSSAFIDNQWLHGERQQPQSWWEACCAVLCRRCAGGLEAQEEEVIQWADDAPGASSATSQALPAQGARTPANRLDPGSLDRTPLLAAVSGRSSPSRTEDICPACGTEYAPMAAACRHCGRPRPSPALSHLSRRSSNSAAERSPEGVSLSETWSAKPALGRQD